MTSLNPSNLRGKGRKAFLYFVELSAVLISIITIATAIRTFGVTEIPVTLLEPTIVSVEQNKNRLDLSHEVHISRTFTYNNSTPTVVTTQLINKDNNDEMVELHDVKISAEHLGTFKTQRLYFVGHLASGNWCVKTTMYWTPFLSLKERNYTSPESCFKVQ